MTNSVIEMMFCLLYCGMVLIDDELGFAALHVSMLLDQQRSEVSHSASCDTLVPLRHGRLAYCADVGTLLRWHKGVAICVKTLFQASFSSALSPPAVTRYSELYQLHARPVQYYCLILHFHLGSKLAEEVHRCFRSS